jgi:predicted nucleic acid-binding protein
MPDLVISNSSPLFYLHRLRHLDLLQKLYQRIVVPDISFFQSRVA